MFFSMARLSLMAAALLLPIYVQAVAFTVDSFEGIAVGKPVNLTWVGDKNPVTIKLMKGNPEALEPVVTLASDQPGEAWTWTPRTIPAGTYCLSITQGTETNYSPQFQVTNDAPAGPAGTKPLSKNKAGPVPPEAARHILVAAMTADQIVPFSHENEYTGLCRFNDSRSSTPPFPCPSDDDWSIGHYQNSAAGVGQMGAAIGAAVVGLTFAVVLVL